jgi:hypothetical protein
MKIAIVGTRGIPNRYGGFEQFAQNLAIELNKIGMEVVVYSPSYRNDVFDNWKGIKIRKIKFFTFFGSFYHFVYDFLSIKDAIKHKNDLIFICGYVTALPAILWYGKYNSIMLVHTDGFEWKRKKWNKFVRILIKYSEKILVKRKIQLVTDHNIIQKYFYEKYNRIVHCIAYGCTLDFDFKLITDKYFLIIARNEKENQIELVLESFISSKIDCELWIFTNKPIASKYNDNNKIKVWLNVYDESLLNNLRFNAQAYIHSYTVGGTNPSLIEAMGHCKIIIAFDNEFHREILANNAFYFKNKHELIEIFRKIQQSEISFRDSYKKIIQEKYLWSNIANQYVSIFKTLKQ